MQQEMGLIRAQLNLIQQTLNVVLEKLQGLEENKDRLNKPVFNGRQSNGGQMPSNSAKSFNVPSGSNQNNGFHCPIVIAENLPTTNKPCINCGITNEPLFSNNRCKRCYELLRRKPYQQQPNQPNPHTPPASSSQTNQSSKTNTAIYFENFISQAIEQANTGEQNQPVKTTTPTTITIDDNDDEGETSLMNSSTRESIEPSSPSFEDTQQKNGRIRICVDCKELKKISGRNKCHILIKHPKACVKCGQIRLLRSKNYCRTCYSQVQRSKNQFQSCCCVGCGQIKPLSSNKLCHSCYMRHYHQMRKSGIKTSHQKVCKKCNKLKPILIDEICRSCTNDPPVMLICQDCGELRHHRACGKCSDCYQKFLNSGNADANLNVQPFSGEQVSELGQEDMEILQDFEQNRPNGIKDEPSILSQTDYQHFGS